MQQKICWPDGNPIGGYTELVELDMDGEL